MGENAGRLEGKEKQPSLTKRLNVLFSTAALVGSLTVACDNKQGEVNVGINEITPSPHVGQQAPEVKSSVEVVTRVTANIDKLERTGFLIVTDSETGERVIGLRDGSSYISDEVLIDSEGFWEKKSSLFRRNGSRWRI